MKKLLAILLAVAMLFCFAACGENAEDELLGMSDVPIDAVELKADYEVPDDFKIGFICLHDEKSTYDLNFLNAVDKIQEVAGLSDEQKRNVLSITDRKEAIRTACALANRGDVVIVAGKGHEDYQEIKGVKHHFDDKEIIREIFNI